MKKLIALLCVMVIMPLFSLGEGVYVPSYSEFMDVFFEQLQTIDTELASAMETECRKDGKWGKHENMYLYGYYNKPKLTIETGNGYLDRISIQIDPEYFADCEEEFKLLAIAAARAILPHHNEEFFQDFFETIRYDYTMTSPAGSITMYTNCDVYLVSIMKTSAIRKIDISLSVYESE